MPGGEARELPEVIRALIMGSRAAGATLFRSSMANEKRLRQSILRDAIRENVDVIEGRLPRGLRRSNRVRRTLFRTSVFIVVPLALFLSINALTTGRGERTDVLVVSAPPAAPAAPAVPATAINAPNGLEPSLFRLEVRSVVI